MTTIIYIPLLNEGTAVLRPAKGRLMSGKLYEVLASEDYDPSLEEWEFPPGAIVECEMKIDNGEKFLQAMREISREQPPQP